MLFKNTGQICYGFGWNTESIQLLIQTQFQLIECYKTLIDDLGNPLGSFDQLGSNFLDECTFSSSGGPISLNIWDIVSEDTEHDVLGGTEADGVGCWSFASWTQWAPYVAQLGYMAVEGAIN